MNELPKKYYIRKEQGDPLWEKYISWLVKSYPDCTHKPTIKMGSNREFYAGHLGMEHNNGIFFRTPSRYSPPLPASAVLITLKKWDQIINKKQNNQLMEDNEIKLGKMPKIIKGIYNDNELRQKCIPLFLGDPGLGKSQVIQQQVDEINKEIEDFNINKKPKEKAKTPIKMLKFVASQRMPNELSGIAMPTTETIKGEAKHLMKFFDYEAFLNLNDGDIVFFDELLNGNVMVLSAMLTILEDRCMISGVKLPNVMFIAAANEQGATKITPQIKERFIYYKVVFDSKLWGQWAIKNLNVTDPIVDDLCTMIEAERFLVTEENYNTGRSFEKAIKMMIKDVPTPYSRRLKPILDKLIENTSGKDITYKRFIWKANEKKPWLKLQRLIVKNS